MCTYKNKKISQPPVKFPITHKRCGTPKGNRQLKQAGGGVFVLNKNLFFLPLFLGFALMVWPLVRAFGS